MTNRERTMNILNYKPVDRMPIVIGMKHWRNGTMKGI